VTGVGVQDVVEEAVVLGAWGVVVLTGATEVFFADADVCALLVVDTAPLVPEGLMSNAI